MGIQRAIKIIQRIKWTGKFKVPSDYLQKFKSALYTFRHQTVYNPKKKRLVHLTDLPSDQPSIGINIDYLGPHYDDDTAQQIAEGVIDPITRQPFTSKLTAFSSKCRKKSRSKSAAVKPQKNTLLHAWGKKMHSASPPPPPQCINANNKNDEEKNLESPAPPSTYFETRFKKRKPQIQIFSDNLEKIEKIKNGQIDFKAFAFNTNTTNNRQIDKENDCVMVQSQTQRIDSIASRHKKVASQRDENKESAPHQFKPVHPIKNIPKKVKSRKMKPFVV